MRNTGPFTLLGSLLACAGMTLAAAGPVEPAPGDRPGKAAAQGPRKGLPSMPGPHVEKIRALADNAWLDLGPPAQDPKWGRARGRSWCAAMPLAPELGGAFLFGEGVHGYAKP